MRAPDGVRPTDRAVDQEEGDVWDQAEWGSRAGAEWSPLAPSQSQVAWLVARGWTDRAIARLLRVSQGTVAEVGRRARRRLGCDGRAGGLGARWRRPPSTSMTIGGRVRGRA